MKIDEYLNNKIGRPLAFVPMCLDPLHHGHINIIRKAKEYGNVIVGLMTDKAMMSYKRKPKIPFEGRLDCLLYTSPSPRDRTRSRMPSSA